MDSGPMPGRLFDVKQNLVASTTRTTYVGDFLELALVPELTRAQKRQLAMIAMELQEEHRWDTSKKPRFRTDFTQKFDINVTEVDAIAPLYVSEINFRQAATSSKEISGWISENMGTLYGDGFQLEIPSHSIYDVLGAKIEDAAKQPGTSSIELSVCKNRMLGGQMVGKHPYLEIFIFRSTPSPEQVFL
ncbi:unnamed protein product, partial [Mesorhabditis spiculigera]